MQILITGGTGFIGKKLCQKLVEDCYEITVLTRQKNLAPSKNIQYIHSLSQKDFNYDIIINLAGEPISQNWSTKNKKKIYESRIGLTRNLVDKINSAKKSPSLFISGSAIGYYGYDAGILYDENSKITLNHNIFSQSICHDWEIAAAIKSQETRLVKIRTGIVLGKNGGALKKMLIPFKLGLGGKIGSGEQFMSWIDIDDAINAINFIIKNNKISGAVNLTSPNPVSNANFSKTLASIVKRPCIFDMPKFITEILFGQMGKELLLKGQKVYPQTLLQNGFEFKYSDLEKSLSKILR